ncbi:Predicted Fe-Mo cluster-binding protein, NifX family [[Luteovulum] sphaeroides subsp. megalophilum]|uniref:NifB/NifX family molybdenum-iron cluster-binding protein n=1 Tax=Cereibacter sphaeroides TaxID=1063 RepID=UPI000B712CAF|nr:NifB/NifX family molybdenum-iron cluster-binding protein [Cereibacter sphaeroides]SNT42934.1 Predicted Fe-Mo cluster-binding protein, NifX family [[Luteovulum] sphaeroides subsp. megalophilum]
MRIAVTSQNFRTITAHAGKTRRFLVFEVRVGEPAHEIERLDLPKEMAIHEFRGSGPHPLDGVEAVISASAGEGFVRRMAVRGVQAVTTSETDPARAAEALAAGQLHPAEPHAHDDGSEADCCSDGH